MSVKHIFFRGVLYEISLDSKNHYKVKYTNKTETREVYYPLVTDHGTALLCDVTSKLKLYSQKNLQCPKITCNVSSHDGNFTIEAGDIVFQNRDGHIVCNQTEFDEELFKIYHHIKDLFFLPTDAIISGTYDLSTLSSLKRLSKKKAFNITKLPVARWKDWISLGVFNNKNQALWIAPVADYLNDRLTLPDLIILHDFDSEKAIAFMHTHFNRIVRHFNHHQLLWDTIQPFVDNLNDEEFDSAYYFNAIFFVKNYAHLNKNMQERVDYFLFLKNELKIDVAKMTYDNFKNVKNTHGNAHAELPLLH